MLSSGNENTPKCQNNVNGFHSLWPDWNSGPGSNIRSKKKT